MCVNLHLQTYTQADDIIAFAKCLYYVYTQKRPSELVENNPMSLPNCPPILNELLHKSSSQAICAMHTLNQVDNN
jgi:hypothetical protein